MNIQEELFKLQDLNYKNFTSKLIPNINKDRIMVKAYRFMCIFFI